MDNGAAHNFIACDQVCSLNLEITYTNSFNVGLGNGSKFSSQCICQTIRVKVGHYTMVMDTFEWCWFNFRDSLADSVGHTTIDRQKKTKKTMSFEDHNQLITLQGHHLRDHPRNLVLQGCSRGLLWKTLHPRAPPILHFLQTCRMSCLLMNMFSFHDKAFSQNVTMIIPSLCF